MKNQEYIKIVGANENNLKNINLNIPRNKFVVITGVSGSGKSSLAFDTIYAEGQRRYVESLSSYARQFLGQMDKPDVESIEGLSPAISIDQKTTSKNPRSTVGTITEIYDYLRLLFARIGQVYCSECDKPISKMSIDQIIDKIMGLPIGTKFQILSPIIKGKKGEHKKEIERLRKDGFVRVRIDGEIYDLSDDIELKKTQKHNIDIVIDRLIMKEDLSKRLSSSVELALKESAGTVYINIIGEDKDIVYNTNYACNEHNISITEMEPRMFSFNSPFGACEECLGIGYLNKVDEDLIIQDEDLSINQGVLLPFSTSVDGTYYVQFISELAKKYKQSLDTPYKNLSEEFKQALLHGDDKNILTFYYESKFGGKRKFSGTFEGIVNNLNRRYNETNSDMMRDKIEEFMQLSPCKLCKGKRLKNEVLFVKINGLNISEVCDLSILNAFEFFNNLELNLDKTFSMIAESILREIKARLKFLCDVGLDYLTLSRSSGTLSGGEAQRIRLSTQIGSGLCGVLYILDEPSIGLHQRDNEKLLNTLRYLCDLGNTLIVVEHDEDTIRACDYIVDIGPYAGENGGNVIFSGEFNKLLKCKNSITADYLNGKRKIEIPKNRRKGNGKFIEIYGASENNLKNIDVKIPLGCFVSVTGVSGSGKSSLVNEILYKALHCALNRTKKRIGKHKKIVGIENIDKVINIDQSPIGKTPRSNPATYTGVFDYIRDLFASTKEAKSRGYLKGRFSFNVKGGRCENCSGDGIIKIEMHFLSDVYVPCDVCKAKRYNSETLQVKYKDKNISEVLDMTVDEALKFFESIPSINKKLQTIQDVGLGYIKLGQSSTLLSGGEAQRVKLATELSKKQTGKTLYILDEPTTGLHIYDVHKLINILDRLVESGNSVVVIEHNLDLIKSSDYIIDIGKEGGDKGGEILCVGTPEKIAENPISYTGAFLKKIL